MRLSTTLGETWIYASTSPNACLTPHVISQSSACSRRCAARLSLVEPLFLSISSNGPYEANTLVAVALILGTGLCDGEVATLRCDDLDPDARSARVIGKGSRERQADLSSGPVRRSPTRVSRHSRHARIGSSTR